jgi:starch synthase
LCVFRAPFQPHASRFIITVENYQQITDFRLSGNPEIENQLNSLLVDYKGNYNTFIGYKKS